MSVGRRILDSVYATVVANGSRVQDSGVTGALKTQGGGERKEGVGVTAGARTRARG